MFLLLPEDRGVFGLTSEQLQYVPKIILLERYGDYVEGLWNRLPEHLRCDPEVRRYRRCLAHYNQPGQRFYIDEPAPLIMDCSTCRAIEARGSHGATCDEDTQT
ncbi:hypothetical protein X777_03560 [Ooceraea biroi]|uniref:Uncharacterized protein n=1 Tax=Ooceraea biroi TaxID=2015173 RepID=A0A026WKK1_OOCBI|nr:hypothetical protein X777_03560 [Ooceraea biroi]